VTFDPETVDGRRRQAIIFYPHGLYKIGGHYVATIIVATCLGPDLQNILL